MYTQVEEKDFLLSFLKKTDRFLEYGSGESTNIISEYVKEIVSVEHNYEWFKKVDEKKNNNVKILYAPVDKPYVEGGHDGTYEQFETYIKIPINYAKFNVVLIDGRARIECFKYIKNVIEENALVFVHDFFVRLESDNYKEMFEYGKLIDYRNQMALFKIIN